MSFLRKRSQRSMLLAAGILMVPLMLTVLYTRVQGSDHGDTTENVQRIGADLTDVFIFPNPANANRVVLAMCVNGLIPAGQALNRSFDPGVLYQFKIDTTGDNVEDQVIQARFGAAGANQTVQIAGPVAPTQTGTVSVFETPFATTGTINQAFTPTAGIQVFAGARSDPFFFDLERFCQILPDRCVPFTPGLQPPADPNLAQATTWRNPGVDFFADKNVLAIVVELPRAQLGNGQIRLWCTTSIAQ